MNSCVLMAKIVRNPELRYIQDNQLAVTDMIVEFETTDKNNPVCTLKTVAWGDLAKDVENQYREGNTVVLTGRLQMNLVQRQGAEYKEKIAELTISHIYPLPTASQADDAMTTGNDYSANDNLNLEEDNELMPDMNLDEMPF